MTSNHNSISCVYDCRAGGGRNEVCQNRFNVRFFASCTVRLRRRTLYWRPGLSLYHHSHLRNTCSQLNIPNWPMPDAHLPTPIQSPTLGSWRLRPLQWDRGVPLGRSQPAWRRLSAARGSRDGLLARPRDARPMTAQPRRLRGRPARCMRPPTRRAHTFGAGQCGSAVSSRRHAHTAT